MVSDQLAEQLLVVKRVVDVGTPSLLFQTPNLFFGNQPVSSFFLVLLKGFSHNNVCKSSLEDNVEPMASILKEPVCK